MNNVSPYNNYISRIFFFSLYTHIYLYPLDKFSHATYKFCDFDFTKC